MVPLPYRALKLGEEAPRVNIVTHENQRYRKKIRGGRKMTNWWTVVFACFMSVAGFAYGIVNRELLSRWG